MEKTIEIQLAEHGERIARAIGHKIALKRVEFDFIKKMPPSVYGSTYLLELQNAILQLAIAAEIARTTK